MLKKIATVFILLFIFQFNGFSQAKKWSLQECVDYAITNNINVKQSELDIKTAQIGKKDAYGNFLPNINASTSHSWSIGSNTNPVTNLRENQTTQYTQLGLSSSIDVYNGLQKQNSYRRAKLEVIASEYQLSKMKDDISLNVANAYLQILFNKENEKVQREQLAFDENQHSRVEQTVNAGVLPRGDLLDAKATVALDRQKITEAENNLFLSKLSLAQLLQLEDYEGFDIADANFELPKSVVLNEKPETIIDKAKQERVELKIAKNNLEIAEKNIKISKGAYQPNVSFGYSFGTNASYSDRLIGIDTSGNPIFSGPLPVLDQFSNNKGHNFGLQVNVPIFNGFATKNNVERSKVASERAKLNLNQTEQELEKNIFTAITNAKGAINNYEASLTLLEARKEAYNYAKEKFAVGLMNSFDFNQSQTIYVNAQSDVLRAKYDSIFKIKIVEFYFGIPITEKK